MKPTIIGTGLSGLVGSRFTQIYKNDFKFVNLDITAGIDITNQGLTKRKIRESDGEVVIHFAAFTDVDAAHQQKNHRSELCYRLNVLGTRHVAQACKLYGKYLIHISTDFIFDGYNPPAGGYTENDSPNPIEWYGQTKLWAEEEIKKSGANHVIVRITYPYRAHYSPKQDVVRSLLNKLKNHTLPPMFTDHIITPTFIDDIAIALKTIIDKRPDGIYHAVGSSHISAYQLASAVAVVFKLDKSQIRKGNLEKFLRNAKRPYQKKLITSNEKLKKELGISMSTLKAGLAEMKRQREFLLRGRHAKSRTN